MDGQSKSVFEGHYAACWGVLQKEEAGAPGGWNDGTEIRKLHSIVSIKQRI